MTPERRPTAKGRPAETRPVDYSWKLAELAERQGLKSSVELGPLLAQRGIVLSDAQVYRLINYTPERLSLKTLSALCDIFECTPNDLIVTTVEGAALPRASSGTMGRAHGQVLAEKGGAADLPEAFVPEKASLGPTRKWR